MSRELLFCEGHLDNALQHQGAEAGEAARTMDADRVLAAPTEDLVDDLTERFWVNPIELQAEAATSSGAKDLDLTIQGLSGRQISVDGTRVTWRIPFAGDAELFKLRPQSYSINPPQAHIDAAKKRVVITYEGRAPLDKDAAKNALTKVLEDITTHVERQRNQIDQFNAALSDQLHQALEKRREKVLADRDLDAYLEIPVPERADPAPSFTVDPPRRPRPDPQRSNTSRSPFAPEPAISQEGFDDIVSELASVTAAVERLPATFVGMPEESLRDVLLVILNNRFGPATGETFSRSGKTDILISYDGDQRAVFIAECKWWSGPADFRKAITQLLGYVTWRDTKAALIIFSNRKDPTAVAAKAQQELESHNLFKRSAGTVAHQPAFVLHHPDDIDREIQIALLVVPVIDNEDTSALDNAR